MPLATLPLISSSSSATMSKSSSFLSSFKKPKSFQMNYVIATPRSANAKTLERGLPTVIFLHAVCEWLLLSPPRSRVTSLLGPPSTRSGC